MNRLAEYESFALRPAPRGFWLGLISVLAGITLLAPPLAVLYEANDESARTSTGASHGIVKTLYAVPPLSVPRSAYMPLRAATTAAAIAALILCVIGVLTMRSLNRGLRLLGIYAVAQIALMAAMVYTAHRFTVTLDAETARQPWSQGVPYGSATRGTAVWAALPGIAYPLVLLWLVARHRRSNRAVRTM